MHGLWHVVFLEFNGLRNYTSHEHSGQAQVCSTWCCKMPPAYICKTELRASSHPRLTTQFHRWGFECFICFSMPGNKSPGEDFVRLFWLCIQSSSPGFSLALITTELRRSEILWVAHNNYNSLLSKVRASSSKYRSNKVNLFFLQPYFTISQFSDSDWRRLCFEFWAISEKSQQAESWDVCCVWVFVCTTWDLPPVHCIFLPVIALSCWRAMDASFL